MSKIHYFCEPEQIESNARVQLEQYAEKPDVQKICAFTDIHYCAEKALPVGVAFETSEYVYPLITGKDIGCGVMYLQINRKDWLKPFNKQEHYQAFVHQHTKMTDDGLGGGNHFLSIEEDENHVYILCHTGTRDRGIALYQWAWKIVHDYALETGELSGGIPFEKMDEKFWNAYQDILTYGNQRRKNFCLKTLSFLQNAGYVFKNKLAFDNKYLSKNFSETANHGEWNGVQYQIGDSIHNHIRVQENGIIHRKGSTELIDNEMVVIPLSMSRGSLLVQAKYKSADSALHSCSHGAGRKLSRFDAMKHWKFGMKEKERRAYKQNFSELLSKNNEFPIGYIQEFDFAYKDQSQIFEYQKYLKQVTQTKPICTVKYSEI